MVDSISSLLLILLNRLLVLKDKPLLLLAMFTPNELSF